MNAAAIYAPKIDKAESRIDWAEPAAVIERKVPRPCPLPRRVVRAGWRAGQACCWPRKVSGAGVIGEVLDSDFTIACGQGAIRPLILQPCGASPGDGACRFPARAAGGGRGVPVIEGARLTRFALTPRNSTARRSTGCSASPTGRACSRASRTPPPPDYRESRRTLNSAGAAPDAGVHASGDAQPMSIWPRTLPRSGWMEGAERAPQAPIPLAVTACEVGAPMIGHARFSCTGRPLPLPPHRQSPRAAWPLQAPTGRGRSRPPLNTDAMHRAAQVLGRAARFHHLAARSIVRPPIPVKTLDLLDVERAKTEMGARKCTSTPAARSFPASSGAQPWSVA